MTSTFSWENSISLCPALFCAPRPVRDFVQETGIKTIPKKKKRKKAKWLSEEALQIAVKGKRKAKGKRKDIPILMQSLRE